MDALPTNRTWPPSCSHDTYQHKAITSRSRQLLMMGTWLPETCWATIRREIKNTKVTSSWFFISTLYLTSYLCPLWNFQLLFCTTGICYSYNKLNALISEIYFWNWFRPDLARKLSTNQYDIYYCCVHSEKNFWWWTEELSETYSFISKIILRK